MKSDDGQHRAILESIARRAMLERGLLPDFSAEVLAELGGIETPAATNGADARDLRDLLWASIDNDDSRDLDQLTVAEAMPGGKVKILVAVADVDSLVGDGSAIDGHARHNTTSVYTAAQVFPMLPEKLSTDLTSLSFNEDRSAMIVEMVIGAEGSLQDSDVYRARVRNHAKLAYNSVAAWLEGSSPVPQAITAASGLDENLRIQDRVAQSLKNLRTAHGALTLQTIEARPAFDGDQIRDLEVEERNRAKDIIADFMIAANGVTARYLPSKQLPSIRRVVRTPKRWDRIVELARAHGTRLPNAPDPKALEQFLVKEQAADPLRFPDLSLTVIKLLGPGEYVAEEPGDRVPGHFGLAVRDYTHSTAPNRRYTDLITQRLLKAAIDARPSPYGKDELEGLAQHCTEEEDAANKVERQVGKSAAALLLESRIGEQFDTLVTGASAKGTWVRLLEMPVEGRLAHGFEGVDVGDRVRVQLISVDVERGYIDFRKVGASRH
ncbi:MAG TPA: RNB domain-containing ribonuclease [Armatimonadota bacterium]|nr:RNB domain-containing ribonuclease [Armatimonadota bacterium]